MDNDITHPPTNARPQGWCVLAPKSVYLSSDQMFYFRLIPILSRLIPTLFIFSFTQTFILLTIAKTMLYNRRIGIEISERIGRENAHQYAPSAQSVVRKTECGKAVDRQAGTAG